MTTSGSPDYTIASLPEDKIPKFMKLALSKSFSVWMSPAGQKVGSLEAKGSNIDTAIAEATIQGIAIRKQLKYVPSSTSNDISTLTLLFTCSLAHMRFIISNGRAWTFWILDMEGRNVLKSATYEYKHNSTTAEKDAKKILHLLYK
jgi:hypothetical protein